MLKTKRAINLSGKMSVLGVSKLSDNVVKAIQEGAQNFYLIKNLYKEVENNIAQKFKSEKAFISSSASACIAQSIAAVKNQLMQQGLDRKVKVVLPQGHFIDYGAKITDIIELGGAEIVPIGATNHLNYHDLETSLLHKPDLAFYVSSHHAVQKNHLDAKTFCDFYQQKNILTVIDIAAEENIWHFAKINADFTIVSGSKAIAGPTSGFILTNEKHLASLEATRSSIGRTMKISKENILGLNMAIEEYQKELKQSTVEKNINIYLNKLKHKSFEASIAKDYQRNISRIKIASNKIKKIVSLLEANNIYTRNYHQINGYIELDLRQVNEEEMTFVISILREVE